MKTTSLLGGLVGLASLASAHPTRPGPGPTRKCVDLKTSVTISAQNVNLAFPAPATNVEVTNFFLNLTQPAGKWPASVVSGASPFPF
jgi:hypothetical protein